MDIEQRRQRNKINRLNSRQRNKDFIADYLSTHPCVDCGESNLIVLTFDHVRGQKTDDISTMVMKGYELEIIETEIEKCEVRCYNCHAIRTHERQKSNRWRRVNGAW